MRWSKDAHEASLKNINFHAMHGKLTCIVGPVGSGKSSIFSSLLGDLQRVEENAEVGSPSFPLQDHLWISGQVAFVNQTAWITNDTIRGNITFGSNFDPSWYNRVISACCLEHDLSILSAGCFRCFPPIVFDAFNEDVE